MPTTSTPSPSSVFPRTSAQTTDGVTQIDLEFAAAMSKGSGSIFVTDGAVQTVIDRVTGEPGLRVVGGSFTREITLDQVSISGAHVMFDAAGLPPGATVNVYMGAGTLLSGGKSAGAITAPGSAAFTMPAGEPPPPPTLTATIGMDGASLKSGEDIAVTITFSKPVADLALASLTAPNATISDLATHDGGTTWTARLTGQAATDAPDNMLRLDMDTVVAGDGSRGTGVEESAPYLVDTLVAAYIDADIEMFDDNGPDDMDGITNGDAMGVGGELHGSLQSGEYIELIINDRPIDPSMIEMTPSGVPGTYYWYYTGADDEQFDLGKNSVQVRIVGADGHSSQVVSKTITVERDTPDIVSKPSATIDATGDIAITFDEEMFLEYNAEVAQTIELVDGLGNKSWIEVDDSMLSEDRKTLTLSPAEHNLATGNDYRLYLPYGLTDLAGNEYDGPAISFSTSGPFQDKAPPRLQQMYIVNGSGSYKADDVLEFRLRYTEKVALDAGTEAVLYLGGGMEAAYAGTANGGTEMVFKYTVKAGDNEEILDDVDHSWTLYGHVRDDLGNVFQHAHVEYDGLTTAGGDAARVSIDTMVAAPGTPQLHADSETSAPGTGTTMHTRPRLLGAGAEAGAAISIYAGGVKVGAAFADETGRWDTALTDALPAGTHQLTVRQEDLAGNVSGFSTAFSLTIAANAPAPLAAPVLDRASDTGVSDDDRITRDDQPTISGSGPAGATLKLKHNGLEIATVITDASGHWVYTLPPLADGPHSFTVQQGDSGAASATLRITVDRTTPSVGPEWNDPVAHLDPGRDLVISFDEAVHFATAEDDSDMIRLIDENGNVQTIAVSATDLSTDKRTLTISVADHDLQPLTGYHVQLPATLTDLAGNAMSEYEIRFSTDNGALPSAVRATVDGDGSYRAGETVTIRVRFDEQVDTWGDGELSLGLSNDLRAAFAGMSTDGSNQALFSFTVAPGDDYTDVRITDTSQLAGRFVDQSGNFLDAEHIALGTLYDTSGDGGRIDIDTVAPAALDLPLLAAGSDTGVSNGDGITSNRTPTFTGTTLANTEVALFANEVEVGRTVSDAFGAWSISIGADRLTTDKSYSIAARQFDAAGNASGYSSSFNLVLDTTAPATALAAPDLDAASDSGSSIVDNITNDSTPTFSGSGALAGGEVALFVGSSEVGRVTADDAGNWSITTALSHGIHEVRVRQYDLAGNQGPDSGPLSVTIDTQAPSLTDLDGSVLGSLLGRRFDLTFSEAIRFHPSGRFELKGVLGSDVYDAADSGHGWQIVDSNILSFNISLSGLLRLQWQNYSVTDLAGNAAIIGVPGWDIPVI